MADKIVRAGKKSRKHGRNLRKPAKQRYTMSKRWITNKAKRILKHKRKHPKAKFPNLSKDVKLEIEILKGKK